MASGKFGVVLCFIFCCSYVTSEDLEPLVQSTEETLQGAKTHVDHMLNLDPLPNHEKLPPILKNESEHLAYEIKKLANSLQEKIAVGEHKPEVKEAVIAAITHLNEAASSLEHVGSDLKLDNTKFYEAADKLLVETKNILAAGPCEEISPILKGALNELTHDVNNYQYGIHDVIGSHEGGPAAGHHHHGQHHHEVHQHHGESSEESNEEKTDKHHHHHH